MYRWVFVNIVLVLGEPKKFQFGAAPIFTIPPIGFGPMGGRVFGEVNLNNTENALLFVVSEPQYEAWKVSITPEELLGGSFDVSGRISTFLEPIVTNRASFDVSFPSGLAERFYVGILFSANSNNFLTIDWIQNDGNFLQFQYAFLAGALRVILALSIVFTIGYFGKYVLLHYKSSTQLHIFYVSVFLFTVAFLNAWIESLDTESVTGQRETWQTKWLPALYQKGFDVLEVLMYLLTALGWQSMRESLTSKEVQIIASGVFLSLMLGVLEIHCGGDEIECGGYTSTRMVIHMFGYLTAIVAFNYHLAFLTASANEGSIAAPQTGFLYVKLLQFWWFRLIFLAFIIQPTVAVVLRTDILGWEDDWIFIAFFWVTKIFLLAALALAFRPGRTNLRLVQLAVKERRRTDQTSNR